MLDLFIIELTELYKNITFYLNNIRDIRVELMFDPNIIANFSKENNLFEIFAIFFQPKKKY